MRTEVDFKIILNQQQSLTSDMKQMKTDIERDVVEGYNGIRHLIKIHNKNFLNIAQTHIETQRIKKIELSKESAILNVPRLKMPVNIKAWRNVHVKAWLLYKVELPQYIKAFHEASIDGILLLKYMDDENMSQNLGITDERHRNKIKEHLNLLKDVQRQVDDYVKHSIERSKQEQLQLGKRSKKKKKKFKKLQRTESSLSSEHVIVETAAVNDGSDELDMALNSQERTLNSRTQVKGSRVRQKLTTRTIPSTCTIEEIRFIVIQAMSALSERLLLKGKCSIANSKVADRGIGLVEEEEEEDVSNECRRDENVINSLNIVDAVGVSDMHMQGPMLSTVRSTGSPPPYAGPSTSPLSNAADRQKVCVEEGEGKSAYDIGDVDTEESEEQDAPPPYSAVTASDNDYERMYENNSTNFETISTSIKSENMSVTDKASAVIVAEDVIETSERLELVYMELLNCHSNDLNNIGAENQLNNGLPVSQVSSELKKSSQIQMKISKNTFNLGILRVLGLTLQRQQFNLFWSAIDTNNVGKITFKEFKIYFNDQIFNNDRVNSYNTFIESVTDVTLQDSGLKVLEKLFKDLSETLRHSVFTISDVFECFDRNGSNDISMAEFCSLLRIILGHEKIDKKQIYNAFYILDKNRTDSISKSELQICIYKIWKWKLQSLKSQLAAMDNATIGTEFVTRKKLLNNEIETIKAAIRRNFERIWRDRQKVSSSLTSSGPIAAVLAYMTNPVFTA